MFFNKIYLEIFVFYTSFSRYFVEEVLKILCGKMWTNCFKLLFFFVFFYCCLVFSVVKGLPLLTTEDYSSKELVFMVKPLQNRNYNTSLIKMPDLRSFAQMKTSTIEFESQDKTLLVATGAEIMMSNLYYFKIPIF